LTSFFTETTLLNNSAVLALVEKNPEKSSFILC
jgi:hypothetical protein